MSFKKPSKKPTKKPLLFLGWCFFFLISVFSLIFPVSLTAQNSSNQISNNFSNRSPSPAVKMETLIQLEKRYPFIATNQDYINNKKVLKYGTYGKQLLVLKKVLVDLREKLKKKENLPEKNLPNSNTNKTEMKNEKPDLKLATGKLYSKIIEAYFDKFPDENFKLFLIEWIGYFHLKEHLSILEDFLNTPTQRNRSADVILKKKVLESLFQLVPKDDKKYHQLYLDFYTDKLKNGGHYEIKSAALFGLSQLKPVELKENIKKAFNAETDSNLKKELILTITAYQDEEDVKFVASILTGETSPFQKVHYLRALTNYPQNNQAKEVLMELYQDKDARVVSESLTALGYFDLDAEFYFEVGKNNKNALRTIAVIELSKEKYKNDAVNDFLIYVAQNDEEQRIKKIARKTLEKRGLWKDGKPLE